jgi:hypothetical protein
LEIIRLNFNYLNHSYNYVAIIEIFMLLIEWFLNLCSFMNRLICPIKHNNNQINYTLKVFYNDLGVYFYVGTIVIFMTYYIYYFILFFHISIIHMYVYCSYIEFEN